MPNFNIASRIIMRLTQGVKSELFWPCFSLTGMVINLFNINRVHNSRNQIKDLSDNIEILLSKEENEKVDQNDFSHSDRIKRSNVEENKTSYNVKRFS